MDEGDEIVARAAALQLALRAADRDRARVRDGEGGAHLRPRAGTAGQTDEGCPFRLTEVGTRAAAGLPT